MLITLNQNNQSDSDGKLVYNSSTCWGHVIWISERKVRKKNSDQIYHEKTLIFFQFFSGFKYRVVFVPEFMLKEN